MRGTDFSTDPSEGRGAKTTTEQGRLDEAIERADALLISSLKTDERRRKRRNTILFLIGGFAMFATICILLVVLATQGQIKLGATEQSGQLAQEGWRLWQQQKLEEAAEKFEEAVKLAPKNTNAWNGLGWSRFNAGKNAEAEKAFQKAIALVLFYMYLP